ncbi:hypothetical protein QFC19_003992 [Naganishia cerealis]|uniref:Uncharacterized protein n=1 Tax=Naganishia cerealis TaxID=610337 RepID=A0ACC2VXZ3_9TREE|nr:hypothetical protein QFC19_003992 [Naganishia cerealis]
MSSFFSDDEQEQERPITSSSSFFPHSSPEPGFDFQSNVGQAGSSRVVRRVVDGVRDELFAGVGDVPAGQALANVGIGLGDGGGDGDAEEEDEDENDVGRLTKVWVRERGTPEIMQWEGELVEECLHKMGQQAQMLDLLRSDPQTSSEEHFKLILVQTEMERVKYLVRAYLRCRLDKVEKFAQWIASSAGDDDARMQVQGRLSQLELSHAEKYAQLLHMHYNDSVLQSLPEKFRSLEVDFGTQRSMVRKPDMAQPVLIYCKKDLPDLILSTYVLPPTLAPL